MKKAIKIILILLLVIVALALAYLAYVLIDYHRIGDQTLPVTGDNTRQPAAGQSYDIVSWNIGFGAYEADYGFFMDGGTQSRAWSKERLLANLAAIGERLREQDADILLVQEVDTDATRSYHVHEDAELEKDLLSCRDYVQVFAQNYDSPYLMYPITQPHGASKAGLSTFADFIIIGAQRVELPIESGFTKFLDLDRCYSRSFIPMEDGKTLVLYNLHLSAYTSDGSIATEQLKLLLADMQGQYEAGNYCIAGGDFNKDLLGDSGAYFGAADKEYTWAQPIPPEVFDGYDITLVAPLDEDAPVPSCRNADGPYHPGQYVLTVDGFLVSANVQVEHSEVIDYGFAYSDHNPVRMRFTLLEQQSQNSDLDASNGLDVYVWQMAADSYSFGLLPHTETPRDALSSELLHLRGTNADETRRMLVSYNLDINDVHIIPWQNPISSYIADYWIITEGESDEGLKAKQDAYIDSIRAMLFGA